MTIRTTNDIDREILLLEEEERLKRNILISHIITPSATIHTMRGLFMGWVRAGRNNGGSENSSGLFSGFIRSFFSLKIFQTVLKQSGSIVNALCSEIFRIVSQFIKR